MLSQFTGVTSSSLRSQVGPQFKAMTSSRGTDTVSTTIPTQAAVGDYLVWIGQNGRSSGVGSFSFESSDWGVEYAPMATGGQFFEQLFIGLKICESSDIGKTITSAASGFYHTNLVMVFSNPNKTFEYAPIAPGGQPVITDPASIARNWINDVLGTGRTLDAPASQITVPTLPLSYGPRYLKICAGASNPDSSPGNTTLSGSYNQQFFVRDGFWFRALAVGYQENATYQESFTVNGASGSQNGLSLYLI
jgi:hypothetical protein